MPEQTSHVEDGHYRGIRGWLLLLCVTFTAGPLVNLAYLGYRLTIWVPNPTQYGKHFLLLSVDAALVLGLVAFAIKVATLLWTWKPSAVPSAKAYLIGYLLYSLFSISVPVVLFGGYYETRFVYLQTAWLIVVPAIAVTVWYLYLSRSNRVRATYGTARLEATVRRHLASTKDLGQVLSLQRDGLSALTALGYFAAALLSSQVYPALDFLLHPETARAGRADATDAVGISFGVSGLLVAIPSAILFSALIGITMSAWQRIAIWGVIGALFGAVSSWLGSASLPMVVSVLQAIGKTPELRPGSAVVAGFLHGGVSECLFMLGLVLAVARWGVRLWSVAVGSLAPALVYGVASTIITGPGLGLITSSVVPLVKSLCEGALIFGGIYLHCVNRAVLSQSPVGGGSKGMIMDNEASGDTEAKGKLSIVGIVIALLSIAAGVKMVVSPGPFGVPLPAAFSQFVAGACLLAWSLMRTRGIALGVAAWFGGAVVGAAVGTLIPFVLH